MLRLELRSFAAANAAHSSSRRRVIPLLVSGAALMAGAIASPGAQAQCTGSTGAELFPFGAGGGINALTSVMGTVNTAFLTNGSAFVSAPAGAGPDQQNGGVWSRTIAGTADTEARSTFNGTQYLAVAIVNPPKAASYGGPVSEHCETKVRQNFTGFQAGQDIAALNSGNTGLNLHFGATAGYVQASVGDVSPGGTLAGNFQVPFVGIYTVLTKGNFFADAQGRLDYFQSELSDPMANGIFGQRLDARGYSFTGNTGYRFDLANKWFVEPSVGGVLSHVSTDPFDISGTLLTGTGTSLPGAVQVQDVDSILGRTSVRIGTTLTSDGGLVVAQPFFTASVFHEFAGNVTASVSSQGNYINASGAALWNINGVMSTSRVGTYEQFGLGSTFQLVNTGWLGYGRVDYRTGDNIQGISVNAGLRYSLNSGDGSIKDGGSLTDSPVDLGGYNWGGPYAGVSIGSIWGSSPATAVAPATGSSDADYAGYLAGVLAGYNYQIGRIVAGVEGDFGSSNARGAKACPNQFYFSCESDLEQMGSLTARLGYGWGRALFYGKGGWAFGDVAVGMHSNPNTTQLADGTPLATTLSTAKWENGWTVGGGMEFALTERWSGKLEYMHTELGKELFTVDKLGGVSQVVSAPSDNDTVRVGVNYHFNR